MPIESLAAAALAGPLQGPFPSYEWRCGRESRFGALGALLFLLVPKTVATQPVGAPMELRFLTPAGVLDPAHVADAWPWIRHPWPIRDHAAETGEGSVPLPVTRDGLELEVALSPEALPSGGMTALYLGLFSSSFTSSEKMAEAWMAEGQLPPPHNPVRLWTLFSHQHPDGRVVPDELGDSCVGEAFRGEFCVRVTACFNAVAADGGGGRWRFALPLHWASNYRVEAYTAPAAPDCLEAGDQGPRWAPPIAERAVPSRSHLARHAAYAQFRLLHVNLACYWWALHARVEPVVSWMEMMSASVEAASRSPAAQRSHEPSPHGLWLEFGVGSGKSTAAIATWMRSLLGGSATLHGFDSFQGLPESWAHTKLGVGTFSTGGVVPEHLASLDNVRIHVGLFSETLADLDKLGAVPVAFAHVDVDLYSSAVEVLSKMACRLLPGSLLVFDEMVNYAGFELSGEFRAWEYVSALYGLAWEYAGIFWQQAVPVVITGRGSAC